MTLHTNEGSYLAHTQGKKHQNNLAERAAKEAKCVRLFSLCMCRCGSCAGGCAAAQGHAGHAGGVARAALDCDQEDCQDWPAGLPRH
jgi:hypothetical protein